VKAMITGITGQDGAYLAQLLLQKGYKVYGCHRRTSSDGFWRLRELGVIDHPNLVLHVLDITDPVSCHYAVQGIDPDEIYNLAAQSFVGASFNQPHATTEATGVGALNMLEAMRKHSGKIRFYQASSSEMFGNEPGPQHERTPFRPRSPYGAAKVLAHNTAVIYREAYGLHVSCGILFNHESPLRGEEFVTRKITMGLAKKRMDENASPLELGNLDASRDWGHARDYVRGMWLMVQQETPDDYVLATGRTTEIWRFLKWAVEACGFVFHEHNDGTVIDRKTEQVLAVVNPALYRPAEVNVLCGDASKARDVLAWRSETTVEELCQEMVDADLARLRFTS